AAADSESAGREEPRSSLPARGRYERWPRRPLVRFDRGSRVCLSPPQEGLMRYRSSCASIMLMLVFSLMLIGAVADAQAWDDTKYPDLNGQWRVIGGPMR